MPPSNQTGKQLDEHPVGQTDKQPTQRSFAVALKQPYVYQPVVQAPRPVDPESEARQAEWQRLFGNGRQPQLDPRIPSWAAATVYNLNAERRVATTLSPAARKGKAVLRNHGKRPYVQGRQNPYGSGHLPGSIYRRNFKVQYDQKTALRAVRKPCRIMSGEDRQKAWRQHAPKCAIDTPHAFKIPIPSNGMISVLSGSNGKVWEQLLQLLEAKNPLQYRPGPRCKVWFNEELDKIVVGLADEPINTTFRLGATKLWWVYLDILDWLAKPGSMTIVEGIKHAYRHSTSGRVEDRIALLYSAPPAGSSEAPAEGTGQPGGKPSETADTTAPTAGSSKTPQGSQQPEAKFDCGPLTAPTDGSSNDLEKLRAAVYKIEDDCKGRPPFESRHETTLSSLR